MTFMVGDRVRVADDYKHHAGELAVVATPSSFQRTDEYTVSFPGDFTAGTWFVEAYALSSVDEPDAPLATVKTKQTFVVTVGGHTHELSEADAYALFRALERVV